MNDNGTHAIDPSTAESVILDRRDRKHLAESLTYMLERTPEATSEKDEAVDAYLDDLAAHLHPDDDSTSDE